MPGWTQMVRGRRKKFQGLHVPPPFLLLPALMCFLVIVQYGKEDLGFYTGLPPPVKGIHRR